MNHAQNFANHRAMPPLSYLAAGLVLLVFTGRSIWRAAAEFNFDSLLLALVALALLVVWNASRSRAMVVQDRLIRNETRLRLQRVLGAHRGADIERLGLKQVIALRFASDAELPALVDAVLAGKLEKPVDIKRAVRDWQGDTLRV
ncbi:MAG: hypothetical protein FJ294_03110 [Planctomycetes bacterium]|nr:hypothetical protein [Planctomycetota bacterium]